MKEKGFICDPCSLPTFYAQRGFKQYLQNWLTWATYPRCRLDRVQEIRRRVKDCSKQELVSECRCGAFELVCEDAPRIITVCHCSVCRYDEALPLKKDNAPAPFFAAVRRDKCILRSTEQNSSLLWRNSSDFARRGRCPKCDTGLVMDYEWFEPNTVWLVRPFWKKEEGTKIDIEFAFNDGKADIDICWNSRADACTDKAQVSYLGKEAVREENDEQNIAPRGVWQCPDMDWTLYYLDCGNLNN